MSEHYLDVVSANYEATKTALSNNQFSVLDNKIGMLNEKVDTKFDIQSMKLDNLNVQINGKLDAQTALINGIERDRLRDDVAEQRFNELRRDRYQYHGYDHGPFHGHGCGYKGYGYGHPIPVTNYTPCGCGERVGQGQGNV
ncbi:hypothetical protein ABEO79_00070 [Micromonospora provocatoris]